MIPSRVEVIVYPHMSRQLVGSTEALGTPGKGTRVRFLARVSTDVSGLMFQSMKRLTASLAFVGSSKVGSLITGFCTSSTHHRWHTGDEGRHHCWISEEWEQ